MHAFSSHQAPARFPVVQHPSSCPSPAAPAATVTLCQPAAACMPPCSPTLPTPACSPCPSPPTLCRPLATMCSTATPSMSRRTFLSMSPPLLPPSIRQWQTWAAQRRPRSARSSRWVACGTQRAGRGNRAADGRAGGLQQEGRRGLCFRQCCQPGSWQLPALVLVLPGAACAARLPNRCCTLVFPALP
jgi:hypothetical protein